MDHSARAPGEAGLQRPNLFDPSQNFLRKVMASPEDLLWLSGFFSGFCRLEEAVPKTCLALDDQVERDGEQQELEAGWAVQPQLESVEKVREGVGSVGGLGMTSRAQKRLEGPKYPHGVHWACWERAGAQLGVLAQHVLWIARKTP